jgi:hypothetical protein
MAIKKLQRGTIYKTDGQVILVLPKDGKKFSLQELQTAVGGYIQMVQPLDKRSQLYVNEEGLLENLPPNGHTRAITNMDYYGDNDMYPGGIVLRGNVISTYRVNPGEENDIGRMYVDEAAKETV